jgi:hypothetical protein
MTPAAAHLTSKLARSQSSTMRVATKMGTSMRAELKLGKFDEADAGNGFDFA